MGKTMIGDAELLRCYAEEKSEYAFAELVRRHIDLVYFTAVRQVGDAHCAEEVAQAVFTDLARKAATLWRRPVLASWLHTSTRFAAAKARRTEERRQRHEQEAATMNALHRDEAAAADWERLRPLIDDVVHELNDRDREAVLLRFFEGRPFADIGVTLGLSEDAARMRVDRALSKLHALLVQRGVTSTAAALGAVLANQAAVAAPSALAATITGAALTGAAVASGSAAASWIGFMSTTKFTSGVATAAILLALGAGVYEVRAGRVAEVALVAERREVYALALRAGEAERQAKEALRRLAQEQRLPADAHHAEAVLAAPEAEVRGPFGPEPPGSRARGRALLAAYPEIKQLLVRDKRAFFAGMYHRLYQELGMTDAQVEAFEQIMIGGVSTTYGAETDIVTLEAAPAMSWSEKEQRIRQLLGERGFQRFDEFQRSPQDSRIVQLASSLYFTDTPLTAEQGAQLQNVLAERNRTGRDQPPAEYWAAVRGQTAVFLSEPQLAALRGLQADDEFNFAREQNQRLRTATEPTRSQ
jgi:RNA polymerase sigma factor (sigma-70 family)